MSMRARNARAPGADLRSDERFRARLKRQVPAFAGPFSPKEPCESNVSRLERQAHADLDVERGLQRRTVPTGASRGVVEVLVEDRRRVDLVARARVERLGVLEVRDRAVDDRVHRVERVVLVRTELLLL